MKTYDEVFQNVMEATNAYRRKVKRIQSAVSASVICAVCIIGASMYVRLEKPESIPPGEETTTTTVTPTGIMPDTMDYTSSSGNYFSDPTELYYKNTDNSITQTIPGIETNSGKNTETGTESEKFPGETQENSQESSQKFSEETESEMHAVSMITNSEMKQTTQALHTTQIYQTETKQTTQALHTTQIYQTETKQTTQALHTTQIYQTETKTETLETFAPGTESATTPALPDESDVFTDETDIPLPTETLEPTEVLETTSDVWACETPEPEYSEETASETEESFFTESETTTTTTITEMPGEFQESFPEEFEKFSESDPEILSDFLADQNRNDILIIPNN
ncbi:MAG: hypothetical protein K2H29_11275 [Oscillospiraceae bacterium]|nr:hypothetical protein [Oscillospiraceae bacterium]MDE5885639.1 hypothetical protein [Oscillospiraceae bacterium]